MEDLHHRQSFDLDFHTRAALQDVRPILAEIRRAFPGRFEVVQPPDAFGSGFSGVFELPDGNRITVEVLSNYQDVEDSELVTTTMAPTLKRVTLSRYLADKIQCVVERTEARDLVDIKAVLDQRPRLEAKARRLVAEQDALLLAERLLGWSDQDISEDLSAYSDVDPRDAMVARDLLLEWVKSARNGASGE